MEQLSEIKQVLTQLKPELSRLFHVQSLGLFCSVVRDDFSTSSDIDIIVDFDRPVGIEFIDLAQYLEQRLQKKVDLVSRRGVKDKYFKAIEQEMFMSKLEPKLLICDILESAQKILDYTTGQSFEDFKNDNNHHLHYLYSASVRANESRNISTAVSPDRCASL